MIKLMTSWWKELDFYSYWEPYREPDWDEEDRNKPLISFSFETWTIETRPSNFDDKNDTGRWRGRHFRMWISRRIFCLNIPYWPLPDHVPTRRQLEERYRNQERHKEFKEKWNAITKV